MKQVGLIQFSFASLLLLGLAACRNDARLDEPQMTEPSEVHSVNRNLAAIRNYLDNARKTATRSGDVELVPYVVSGDTVMYVANYDEGWEVFSNDNRLPMVLMKSETGSFNPYSLLSDNPFDGYFKSVGEDLQKIGIENTDEPEGMWQVFSAPDPNPTNPGTGQYQMVGLACETTTTEYTPRGGRLSTQWGQYLQSYNQFTPYYLDKPTLHSLAGCGAVAVGQFIYFYQRYFNPSMTTVTDAVYCSDTNSYSFCGNSNTVWQLFDDGSDKEMTKDLVRMKPTALFLGHIGVLIHTNYGDVYGEESGSTDWGALDCLFNYCHLNQKLISFNYTKLINCLKSGIPSVAFSTGKKTTEDGNITLAGHIYIIDYAKTIDNEIYEVYANMTSNPISPPDINPSEPIGNPFGPSLSYYRSKYGSIDYNFSFKETERWVKMNWGWHGLKNNVLINAELPTWIIDRYSISMDINDTIILSNHKITVIE